MGTIALNGQAWHAAVNSGRFTIEGDVDDPVPISILNIIVISCIGLIGNGHIGSLGKSREVQLNLNGLNLILLDDFVEVGIVFHAR